MFLFTGLKQNEKFFSFYREKLNNSSHFSSNLIPNVVSIGVKNYTRHVYSYSHTNQLKRQGHLNHGKRFAGSNTYTVCKLDKTSWTVSRMCNNSVIIQYGQEAEQVWFG